MGGKEKDKKIRRKEEKMMGGQAGRQAGMEGRRNSVRQNERNE